MPKGRKASSAEGDRTTTRFRLGLIERIEYMLKARDCIRSGLARKVEVAPDAVTLWLDPDPPERNKNRMPTLEQLKRMAEELDTSCDYLLGLTPDPSPPSAEKRQLPRRDVERALGYAIDTADALRLALEKPKATFQQVPPPDVPRQDSTTTRAPAKRVEGKSEASAKAMKKPKANDGKG